MGPASPPTGLCDSCAHRKAVGNRRGSRFTLCLRSQADPRFPRYPPLPVLRCAGYEKGAEDPWRHLAREEEQGETDE